MSHVARFNAWKLLSWLTLAVGGCAGPLMDPAETVLVDTYPSGALVYVEGKLAGTTPLSLTLSKLSAHQLRLEREHYTEAAITIAPERNARGEKFVRFGLAEAAGRYHNLRPNPVMIYLEPELIPADRSKDDFQALTEAVSRADALLRQGEISEAEHAYMIARLTEYFTQ